MRQYWTYRQLITPITTAAILTVRVDRFSYNLYNRVIHRDLLLGTQLRLWIGEIAQKRIQPKGVYYSTETKQNCYLLS